MVIRTLASWGCCEIGYGLMPPFSLFPLAHSLRLSGASQEGELGKPSQAKQEEEGPSFPKGILAVLHQLIAHRERPSALDRPCLALGSTRGDTEQEQRGGHSMGKGLPQREPRAVLSLPPPLCTQGPPHKGALQPQEEPLGPLWGTRQAPNSGGPVKKQLRLEEERCLEFRLQNLHLQQENIKVGCWGGDIRQGRGGGLPCRFLWSLHQGEATERAQHD